MHTGTPMRCSPALSLLLLVACTAELPPAELSRAAIIDGELANTASMGTLMVRGAGLCTGVLISERVVLTAKHCVVDYVGRPRELEIAHGESMATGVHYADVLEVRVTDGGRLESDIAAILLTESGTMIPSPWAHLPSEAVGMRVTAVGYGQEDVGPLGTGRVGHRASVETEIVRVGASEFMVAGPTTCFGDSGGPALMSGRVVGVVSRGAENCDGPSLYTRTSSFRYFIEQAVLDAGDSLDHEPLPEEPAFAESVAQGCNVGSASPAGAGAAAALMLAIYAALNRRRPS